ncbi:MAG: folylpolyglutamate synthase/dihydrofolate synthase family protein [Lachnospiraceae bacterium]|nr:folylpolyglutamate synthase/dihydrofolate synthase family protein [Lachnospiraceae bacterium]
MFTYEDAVKAIDEIPKFLEAPSVAHTRAVLDAIGAPDENMKIIHVAGTNGKGSVCAFVSSMLSSQGKKVGTFTSPHLIKMNERIKINNVPVSDDEFLRSYLHVKECCKELGEMNYFEYLFAMGMDIFSKADLDYVVLEVGLGGRMDGTNAIKAPVCCAITSISMDHVEILGNTISEIAAAKAGIIKPGAKVVYDNTRAEASEVIRKEAALYGNDAAGVDASWYERAGMDKGNLMIDVKKGAFAGSRLYIPFIAEYQAINALLAVSVMEALGMMETAEQIEEARGGLMMTRWPGRMQQVLPGVYIDGAHNEDGIGKFVQAVQAVPCSGRKLLLFSAVKEKDVDLMARHIGREADFAEIMITEIENSRQLGCEILADRLKHYYEGPVEICPGIRKAFDKAMSEKKEEDILFIAGSLYLAGSIMEFLQTDKE